MFAYHVWVMSRNGSQDSAKGSVLPHFHVGMCAGKLWGIVIDISQMDRHPGGVYVAAIVPSAAALARQDSNTEIHQYIFLVSICVANTCIQRVSGDHARH